MGQRSDAMIDAAAHPDRVRSVLDDSAGPARSALAASWRRSITLYGLDPEDRRSPEVLTAQELAAARQEIEPLMRAAQLTLDRLFQAVGDAGCCVLLTNKDGVPVDRRGVDADDEQFRRWGLWSGTVWSEAAEGANGIGTCLAEGRALTIHRDQHFHTRNIGLSCTAAPIYDHQGRLAAALDVSSARADLTEGFVGLITAAVSDAARAIEAAHFREAFSQTRIVLPPGGERTARLCWPWTGTIWWSGRRGRRGRCWTSPTPASPASCRPRTCCRSVAAERNWSRPNAGLCAGPWRGRTAMSRPPRGRWASAGRPCTGS